MSIAMRIIIMVDFGLMSPTLDLTMRIQVIIKTAAYTLLISDRILPYFISHVCINQGRDRCQPYA